jgi:tetratricopeptide (TPR) repeat protein
MMGVANVLTDMNRHTEALQTQIRAVDILRVQVGPDHHLLASNLSNLAVRLSHLGRHEEAMEAAREAVEVDLRAGWEILPGHAYHYMTLSEASRGLEHHGEAVEFAAHAVKIFTGALGARHPKVSWAQAELGYSYLGLGDLEAAREALSLAIELFGTGVDDPRTLARMEFGLARALDPQDRERALALARGSLRTYESLPYAAEEAREVETWIKN